MNDKEFIASWAAVIMVMVVILLLGMLSGYLYVIQEAGYCVDYNKAMTVVDCMKVQGW